RHRPHDAVAVGQPRQPWHQLADLRAGDAGADRRVGAADLGRGVGLEVPAVVMAGPAVLHDEDARLFRGPPRPARLEQLGQPQSEDADAADLQESTAREPRTMFHVNPPGRFQNLPTIVLSRSARQVLEFWRIRFRFALALRRYRRQDDGPGALVEGREGIPHRFPWRREGFVLRRGRRGGLFGVAWLR